MTSKKVVIAIAAIGALACTTIPAMESAPVFVNRDASPAAISETISNSLAAQYAAQGGLRDRNVMTFRVPVFKCVGPICGRQDQVFEKQCNETVQESYQNSSANLNPVGSGGGGFIGDPGGGSVGDSGCITIGGGTGNACTSVPGPGGGESCEKVKLPEQIVCF